MSAVTRAVALLAALGVAAAGAHAAPEPPSLCTPPQRVMFHCSLGTKAVSLCADMSGEAIDALDFRYGRPGGIEMSHVARSADGRRFAGTVSRVARGGMVRQVWYSSGQMTYLLSHCVGGACARAAGYSVLRGGEVLSHERCVRASDGRGAGFAPALALFGRDAASSRSHTPLLVFREVDLGVDALYRPR